MFIILDHPVLYVLYFLHSVREMYQFSSESIGKQMMSLNTSQIYLHKVELYVIVCEANTCFSRSFVYDKCH